MGANQPCGVALLITDDFVHQADQAVDRAAAAARAADEADAALGLMMKRALEILLKPGKIINRRDRHCPDWLVSARTTAGNDRGTHLFRIAGKLSIEVKGSMPCLSAWRVDAVPISEKTGKDMLASAGNKGRTRETVRLSGYIGGRDRDESSKDAVLRMVRAAIEASKGGGQE